jgi:hypothetical protein
MDECSARYREAPPANIAGSNRDNHLARVVPKLELIYHVPYALIIPVCIGGALIGHIALTRALVGRKRQ